MDLFIQILLPLSLAFIMFAMGLTLSIDDFKRVAKFPKAFILGFILQVISLPLLAFLIASIWTKYFGFPPLMAVGIIIIAACPGGVTSNLMVYLGRGDSALSISLTAVISCLSVLTIPFIINIGLQQFIQQDQIPEINITKMVIGIFLITTVPLILGMLTKAKQSLFAEKNEIIFRRISSLLFIFIVVVVVIQQWPAIKEHMLQIAPLVLSLCALVMLVAIAAAKLAGLNEQQVRAIALECGLQNGTLAIFIALTVFESNEMMLPTAAYGLLMYIPAGLYLWYLSNKDKKSPL